ncbi:RluA family pseudouridine synthase [Bdellovibrio sp. HCB337]|uniref:RluA family pseudouridine synthase n=1 Tax=Bdellovibrio sp. HCB337 TaxID=3394358 RepID=UPI0039A48C1E
MNLNIIFENSHFAILDKDAMVLTTPSREGESDQRECLGLELQKQLKQQIFPVHRLDFEVSGLVLFAKTAEAHAKANTWFERKQVFKTYLAFSEGQSFEHIPANVKNHRTKMDPKEGEKFFWKSRLLRGKKRAYDHATGKPSETEAVYVGYDVSQKWHRWELHPLTGRPHQLRFELSSHGFPIVGDELYGAKRVFNKPGIALRAIRIDFSRAAGAKELGLPQVVEVPGLL